MRGNCTCLLTNCRSAAKAAQVGFADLETSAFIISGRFLRRLQLTALSVCTLVWILVLTISDFYETQACACAWFIRFCLFCIAGFVFLQKGGTFLTTFSCVNAPFWCNCLRKLLRIHSYTSARPFIFFAGSKNRTVLWARRDMLYVVSHCF